MRRLRRRVLSTGARHAVAMLRDVVVEFVARVAIRAGRPAGIGRAARSSLEASCVTGLLTLLRRRPTRVVAVGTIAEAPSARHGVLLPEGAGLRFGPATTRRRSVEPQLRWSVLTGVSVRYDLGGVLLDDRLLLPRDAVEAVATGRPLSKGPVRAASARRAVVDDEVSVERLTAGVMLSGFAPRAYYHALIERVASAALLDLLPPDLHGVPWLLPAPTLEIGAVAEALHILSPSRVVVPLRPGIDYRVDRLVWIDPPHVWSPWLGYASTHLTGLGHLRERILDHLGVEPGADARERLFLVRGERRRSPNEAALLARAVDLGFRPWRPELEPLESQVRTWATAGRVVGETGAAWSGLLWAAPGGRGLCLTSEHPMAWSHLAAVSGFDLHESPVLGGAISGYSSTPVDPDAFEVDLRALDT